MRNPAATCTDFLQIVWEIKPPERNPDHKINSMYFVHHDSSCQISGVLLQFGMRLIDRHYCPGTGFIEAPLPNQKQMASFLLFELSVCRSDLCCFQRSVIFAVMVHEIASQHSSVLGQGWGIQGFPCLLWDTRRHSASTWFRLQNSNTQQQPAVQYSSCLHLLQDSDEQRVLCSDRVNGLHFFLVPGTAPWWAREGLARVSLVQVGPHAWVQPSQRSR